MGQNTYLTINQAPCREYAFTLRRTTLKELHTEYMYSVHLEKFVTKGYCTIKDFVFETTAGLHVHGILSVPKGVDLKRFRVRGWRMYLDELYDELGWKMYYMKEQRIRLDSDNDEELKEVQKVIDTHKKKLFLSV